MGNGWFSKPIDLKPSKSFQNRRAASAKEKESYRWIEHFFRKQNLAETIDNLEIVYVAELKVIKNYNPNE